VTYAEDVVRTPCYVAAFWLTVFVTHAARAETPEEARAHQLFDDAVAGRCADACACYAESLALAESPAAHLNLAHCEEQRGRLAAARDHWTRGLELLPPDDPRAATATDRLASLDARMPRMVFQLAAPPSPGMRILVDGHDLGPAALRGASVLADPGRHTVSIVEPGVAERRFEIELAEGAKKSVVVEPGAPSASAPLPVRSVVVERGGGRADTGENLETAGSIIGGLGVCGLVAAAITGTVIMDNDAEIEAECVDKRCTARGLELVDESNRLLVANSILWATGGIATLTGGALLIAGGAMRAGGSAFTIVPAPMGNGAGVVAFGRFP
jgi:hypothetical protein